MNANRSEAELRQIRKQFFDTFPQEPSARQIVDYQERLVQEIYMTEAEQHVQKTDERKLHLHLLRTYGDALSWKHLSAYAIRRLSRNAGHHASIQNQGDSFKLVVESAKAIAEEDTVAIIADVTNALKNGDLIVCTDLDAPELIECKNSNRRDSRFERQGRRGRQLSRIESIAKYIREGRGVISGEDVERLTVTIHHKDQFNYPTVEEIVLDALDHNPTTLLLSQDELYSAALLGEVSNGRQVLASWGVTPSETVALGNSVDSLFEARPDFPPPILWDISPQSRWALMEGDVSITHAVRLNAFLGMHIGEASISSLVPMKGKLPWGYEISINGKIIMMNPRLVYDVVYGYETIASASEKALEVAISIFSSDQTDPA